MTLETQKGMKSHAQKLFEAKILKECQYLFNTLFLLVQKLDNNEYRLVQDLRTVNNAVKTLYPTVPVSFYLIEFGIPY